MDKFQNLELVVDLSLKNKAALKREVVFAVLAGGHPGAVGEEYGVSRASVYSWVKDCRKAGVKSLMQEKLDRHFALPGKTPAETIRNILGILRLHPEYSADRLSDIYGSYGFHIPQRTMRAIFQAVGAGTDAQRREKAFQLDRSHITDEVLDAVILEIEIEEKRERSGRRPGDVLVQDRFKFPAGLCDEPLAIELIVDTFASNKRIFAKIGTPTEQLSKSAFEEVQRIYEQQSHRIHKICTPRKRQYSGDLGAFAYPVHVRKFNYTILDVRPAASRQKDSRINAAWATLQTQWLKTLPKRLPLKDINPKRIGDDLEDWLEAYRK